MAKKVKKVLKLIISAGKANPAPPLGPILSAAQVNIQEFCTKFNDATRQLGDIKIPATLSIYEDRTFSMTLGKPPMSELIKKKLNIKKGSSVPNLKKVGKLTRKQALEIIEEKMEDLNTSNIDSAMKILEGTARQMGVKIVD